MALVENGPDRMGQVVQVSNRGGQPIEARIIDPVLYDKAGEKLNG
jgi:sarcosine oxidase subunit alpha